jgi:hypothetical protein
VLLACAGHFGRALIDRPVSGEGVNGALAARTKAEVPVLISRATVIWLSILCALALDASALSRTRASSN